MRMFVRPIRPDETTEAGALVLRAYDDAGPVTGPYRERVADVAARVRDGSLVLVAAGETGLLGCVTFTDRGDPHFESEGDADCGFRMLGVAPEGQGRSVGTALVRACIDTARERGRYRLAIHTMAWMAAAQALYERLGFTRRPDRDVRFPLGVGLAYQLDLREDAGQRFLAPRPVVAALPWFEDAWRERERRWAARSAS